MLISDGFSFHQKSFFPWFHFFRCTINASPLLVDVFFLTLDDVRFFSIMSQFVHINMAFVMHQSGIKIDVYSVFGEGS